MLLLLDSISIAQMHNKSYLKRTHKNDFKFKLFLMKEGKGRFGKLNNLNFCIVLEKNNKK